MKYSEIFSSLIAVRGFLGLTGYYHCSVHHYATIAGPLTDLVKKRNSSWSLEAVVAFSQLKVIMTTTPVLSLPYFNASFQIDMDASSGAVISQGCHPLAYFSKKMTSYMQAASA